MIKGVCFPNRNELLRKLQLGEVEREQTGKTY